MSNPTLQENGQPSKRSWWGRNWIWVVPIGCLIPTFVCCGVGFVTLIVGGVFGGIKSSDAYKEAVAKAKSNEAVQAALGLPIEEGFFVTGNIHVNGPNGKANLAIPISGPKGSATITAIADKQAGRWTYSTLEVAVHGGNRVNLLEKK
jgi:Cytochrome oxidase complex assembly protein 1